MTWHHQGNEWYTDVRGPLETWAWVKVRDGGAYYDWRVENLADVDIASGQAGTLEGAQAAALAALERATA